MAQVLASSNVVGVLLLILVSKDLQMVNNSWLQAGYSSIVDSGVFLVDAVVEDQSALNRYALRELVLCCCGCRCAAVRSTPLRALDLHEGRQMRRLSLRRGEAAVLAQVLVLWAVDACVYTTQEVKRGL